MSRRISSVFSLSLVSLSMLGLAGCGLVQGGSSAATAVTASPVSAARATGIVHGGQQPVTGATIQLYQVGTSGYGSGASALIGTTVTTSDGSGLMNANANPGNGYNTLPAGDFSLAGAFSCPTAGTLVYLVASGGNPGLVAGTNNSAIVMMTAVGQCGSITSSSFITINEVTTVAAAYALAEFSSLTGSVGAPSGTAAGIATAFANVNNLVNNSTGTALALDAAGNTVPQSTIDTFANTVIPCVNSTGPTSSACSTLFADVSSGLSPQTVYAAILDLALSPNVNTTTFLGLSSSNPAFQPALSSPPHNWSLTLGGAASICGYSGPGYTVSGTVAYTGVKTGRIYLALNNNTCGGGGTVGTSISSRGSFSIAGVPPGTYTLSAFMETLGTGAQNLADPSGSSTVTVSSSNVGSQTVTLVDPSAPTLNSGPGIGTMIGFNFGIFAFYNPIKNNGVEAATSYTLQWSTSSSFGTIAGSKTFAANGTHTAVWLVNGLTDGSVYYFRAYGTSAGTAVSPYSSVYGPVTVGAPASGSTVSGAVTFSGTASGPMYVGVYNQYTSTAYAQYIANPVSPQAFSVVVPSNSIAVYKPFALIDQNNDGLIDAGDIQNVNGTPGIGSVAVTGALANQNLTLSSSNSAVSVTTQTNLSGGQVSYNFGFQVLPLAKLPVTVQLASSSNADGANVTGPIDIALCQNGSGCGQGFQNFYNLASSPSVGDTYFFNVGYSDGTSETVAAAMTGVLTSFATNLAPTTGSSTSTTPTFSWTAPVCSLCSTYVYGFQIGPSNGNQVWQVPGNATGLPYTTTSLTWSVDPTDSSNLPSVSSLTLGTAYTWQLVVQDVNGNQATNQVNYTP